MIGVRRPSVRLSVRPSVRLFVCPSVRPTVRLSVRSSACLSVSLSVRLSDVALEYTFKKFPPFPKKDLIKMIHQNR